MSPAARAGGYWPPGPGQATGAPSPQVNTWPLRSSVIHYDYNLSPFNTPGATSVNDRQDPKFESKEEQAAGHSALKLAHDIGQ